MLATAALALGALPVHSYVACAGAAMFASFIGHSLINVAVRTTPTHLHDRMQQRAAEL